MADGKMKIFSNFIIIEILAFVSTPPYRTKICEGSFQVGQECYELIQNLKTFSAYMRFNLSWVTVLKSR